MFVEYYYWFACIAKFVVCSPQSPCHLFISCVTLWNFVSVCKLSDEEEKTLKEKWQSKLGPQYEVMVRLICILSCLADSYFPQLRFVSVSLHIFMYIVCLFSVCLFVLFSIHLSIHLLMRYCIYIVSCMCAGGPGTEIHWERWSWFEFGG